MKPLTEPLVVALIAFFWPAAVAAQEMHTTPPPKLLVVTREFVKPGRGGATHEKTESLYIQALNSGKSNTRYIGMEALSGKSRVLFFSGYGSVAAWQEAEKADKNDAVLSAAMARADIADRDLLESFDRSVWIYDEENSQTPVDIAPARYFEIELFQVRPGHNEWIELSKLLKAWFAKALPGRHWALYENMYGLPESSFLVVTPLKSAADVDEVLTASPEFTAAVGGEEGMKHVFELESAAVASSETNLFEVNPRMSRPPESWVKADPSFWAPKRAEGAPANTGTKPSAQKP